MIKRRIHVISLLMLMGAMSIPANAQCEAVNSYDRDVVEQSVRELLSRYPCATLADIYKSSFQNVYGPGHLAPDSISAQRYLDYELSQPFLYADEDVEECIPDGRYVRVNLDVLRKGRIDKKTFIDTFLESMQGVAPVSTESWRKQWEGIITIIEGMDIFIPNYETDKFRIEENLKAGKFVGEHSEQYHEAYDPHYRLIHKTLYEQKLLPILETP